MFVTVGGSRRSISTAVNCVSGICEGGQHNSGGNWLGRCERTRAWDPIQRSVYEFRPHRDIYH